MVSCTRGSALVPLALLLVAGCATPEKAHVPPPISAPSIARFENTDLTVRLAAVIGRGHEQTLVEDTHWSEFILDIENRNARPLTVRNVQLLNTNGRYVNSASGYEQITAPPDVNAEVAGDIAERGAGIILGHFVPFGGQLIGAVGTAASASDAEARAKAKQAFYTRVLKSVELAPAGKMTGSAFLPNITNAEMLIIDYTVHGTNKERIELPLPDAVRFTW